MANHYTSTGSVTRYNRLLPGSSDGAFRGADFSSEASLVDQTRLAFVRNMWRDYESENGGCVETSPGFRLCKLIENNGKAHGLWDYRYNDVDYVICHMGTSLYAIRHDSRDSGIADLPIPVSTAVADADSQAFVFNGKFYLLDGTTYWMMNGVSSLSAVSSGSPYVPITYSDEEEYEQRNMLTDSFIERWNVVDVSTRIAEDNYGVVLSLNGTTATVTGINSTRRALYIPGSYTIDGVTYDTVNIAAGAFRNNTRLRNIVILKCGVIGENAFNGCTSLSSVTIHSFGEIQANAFAGTTALYTAWLGGNGTISETAFGASHTPTMNLLFTREEDSNIAISGHPMQFNCSMYVGVAGEMLTMSETYPTYTSAKVFVNQGSYIGTPKEPLSDSGSWAVDLYRPRSKVEMRLDGDNIKSKHIAITIVGVDGSIFEDASATDGASLASDNEDAACAADFYILDPCSTVTKITLQGAVTGGKERGMTVWYNHNTKLISGAEIDGVNCEVYKDGTSYYTRVRLFATSPGLLRDVVLKLYGTAAAGKFSTSAGAANYVDASGGYTGTSKAAINRCNVCTVFDGRPFFTGNPDLPNTVFYCGRRSDTGIIDPGYIGVCSFFNDGTGNSRNNALLAAGSVLMVFKERSGVEGSIFYHSPRETGLDFLPKDYPSVEGASGYDCLGAAYNFLDDYVFVTASGLSAVDKQQLNLERTIGHRSSNIDRLLGGIDLSKAKLCEWKGYLVLCCEGEIFLADSRKMFENATGGAEYEWFRLTDIGYWWNQRQMYKTMTGSEINGIPITGYQLVQYGAATGRYLTVSDVAREAVSFTTGTFAAENGETIQMHYDPTTMEAVTLTDEYVGGYFCPARQVLNLGGVLYFSFDNGGICCFNTDKRGINFCTYSNGSDALYVPESGSMISVRLKSSDEVVQSGEIVPAYIYETGKGYRLWGEIPIERGSDGHIYRLELPLNPVSRYEMDSHWYTYCGRSYRSELATRYDDCGSPFLAKNTLHDSLVITAKSMSNSNFLMMVRTDREEWGAWKIIERTVASQADFTNFYFDAHSFRSRRMLIYKSREREKKWVRKQYCLQVDCFRTPFGIYNLGYGYTIYGKVRT